MDDVRDSCTTQNAPALTIVAVSMLVARNSDGLVAPASKRIGLWDNFVSKCNVS